MKSENRIARDLIDRMNSKRAITPSKKGQTLSLVMGIIGSIFVSIFIVFAYLYGISALNPGAFFAAGSENQNLTNGMVTNFTAGIQIFFATLPTAFKVLGIVFILTFIGLLIVVVTRFRQNSGGGSL